MCVMVCVQCCVCVMLCVCVCVCERERENSVFWGGRGGVVFCLFVVVFLMRWSLATISCVCRF